MFKKATFFALALACSELQGNDLQPIYGSHYTVLMPVGMEDGGVVYSPEVGYGVFDGKQLHKVAPYNVDPIIRNIAPENLLKFFKSGYLKVLRSQEGTFKINAQIRMVGGGDPVFYITGVVLFAASSAVTFLSGGTLSLVSGRFATATGLRLFQEIMQDLFGRDPSRDRARTEEERRAAEQVVAERLSQMSEEEIAFMQNPQNRERLVASFMNLNEFAQTRQNGVTDLNASLGADNIRFSLNTTF